MAEVYTNNFRRRKRAKQDLQLKIIGMKMYENFKSTQDFCCFCGRVILIS